MDVLRGKRALVTGASSGLGAEFAAQLAAAGCDLVLVARREDRLREVADAARSGSGVEVDVLAADLGTREGCDGLHERLSGAGKQVDVLVNNAGFGVYGDFAGTPWERTLAMLELDVVSLVHLTRVFLPAMIERRTGWVLMVSSIGAFQPTPTYAAYSAAKSFVLSFGEAVNHELRGTGVSVTVLSPGVTATEFLEVAGQRTTLYQRLMMMRSKDVVRTGIRAMLLRRPSAVAGFLNRLSAWSMRFLPRRLATIIAHLTMKQPAGTT